jgi:hypothetical protein
MRQVRMDRSDARLNVSRLRQRAPARRLAGRLAFARQVLQSSTGSDCRGRRRKAKQGRRNRRLAEVKGETKNVSSSKYLSGAKTCTLRLPSRDMCRRDRADTVGTELRDWAEIKSGECLRSEKSWWT